MQTSRGAPPLRHELPALSLFDSLKHLTVAEREHLCVDIVTVGNTRDLNAMLFDELLEGRRVFNVNRGLATQIPVFLNSPEDLWVR